MASGLFYISMFFITVISILLFAPGGMQPYQSTDNPTQLEASQKEITVKMAQFLEKNPKMVQQETFERSTSPLTRNEPSGPVTIRFLNSDMSFPSRTEYDEWVQDQLRHDPYSFIRELSAVDDPDLFLTTLKKLIDTNTDESVREIALNAHLEKAESLIQKKDQFSQEMTQRMLQQYLDLEKDPTKAKQNVDAFLLKHQ